jgi:hypothetical protein
LLIALGVALFLRAKAPPEAARLLPESDAIVFLQLKTLRAATHFDQTPVARSPDFQHFIDATGIVPERDIDSLAFALHRMPDPHGPNGPVAYSEVIVGRFDGVKLAAYLASIASAKEVYAGRDIYAVPIEGRTLRVTQLSYDTIAASNMPTAEQIHSILDRSRASALSNPGSSLLAQRYHQVPLLSQAWGIGHIGLPFGQDGRIALFGLELPLPVDTDFVASLRYAGSVHLRIEEYATVATVARNTVDALNPLLNIAKGLVADSPAAGSSAADDTAAVALRQILDTAEITQHGDQAVLTATATAEQLRNLAAGHTPTAPATTPTPH